MRPHLKPGNNYTAELNELLLGRREHVFRSQPGPVQLMWPGARIIKRSALCRLRAALERCIASLAEKASGTARSSMYTTLLIIHGLVAVALLGAITHQSISMLRRRSVRNGSFVDRYTGVSQKTFTAAVVSLYVVGVILGAFIYPKYRLDVRVPFEEMRLGWAIGLFELKEHFAGIGLGVLPLYAFSWSVAAEGYGRIRTALTLLLLFIVWWDFIVGHVLNNIRGFA
jgi:hypothetical protein